MPKYRKYGSIFPSTGVLEDSYKIYRKNWKYSSAGIPEIYIDQAISKIQQVDVVTDTQTHTNILPLPSLPVKIYIHFILCHFIVDLIYSDHKLSI